MLRRTALTRLAVPTAAVMTIGLAIPALHAAAAPSPAEECVQAGNVWIHVEYDETVTGACATEFASAQEALHTTGLTEDDGWVTTIDGRLSVDKEWWSVYFLSPNEDGTYPAAWEFAQVGVAELELFPGEVLAMKLQADYEVDAVAPAVNPVDGVVLGEPEPSVSPSPSPSVSPSPSASPSPVVTAEPSVSSTPTAEVTVSVPATAAPARPGLPKTGN